MPKFATQRSRLIKPSLIILAGWRLHPLWRCFLDWCLGLANFSNMSECPNWSVCFLDISKCLSFQTKAFWTCLAKVLVSSFSAALWFPQGKGARVGLGADCCKCSLTQAMSHGSNLSKIKTTLRPSWCEFLKNTRVCWSMQTIAFGNRWKEMEIDQIFWIDFDGETVSETGEIGEFWWCFHDFFREDGRPVGLQVLAAYGGDAMVLRAAAALERHLELPKGIASPRRGTCELPTEGPRSSKNGCARISWGTSTSTWYYDIHIIYNICSYEASVLKQHGTILLRNGPWAALGDNLKIPNA